VLEEAEGYQRLMDEFRHTQDVLAHASAKAAAMSRYAAFVKAARARQEIFAGRSAERRSCARAGRLRQCRKTGRGYCEPGPQRAPDGETCQGLRHRQGWQSDREETRFKKFCARDVDVMALEEKMTSLLG